MHRERSLLLPAPGAIILTRLFGTRIQAKPGSWLMITRVTPVSALAKTVPDLAGALARRNPRLLFRLSGVFLLRLAERTLRGLLFHEPPRFTR